MVIVKCPWKSCAYNKHDLCCAKHNVIELGQVETDNEDDEFLVCKTFTWVAEPDNIDEFCE